MLALTRKKDEAIIINGNIEIKILEVKGDKVRVGITAPSDIDIYREEVYLQVLESNKKACAMEKNALADLNKLIKR